MVNIQIVSDLHLEFRGLNFKTLIKPSADILFLLGDICVLGTQNDWALYQEFIKYISPKFKYIFHVPGNHEYYTSNRNITKENTVPGIDFKLKKFSKSVSNLFILNNNTTRLNIDKKTYVFIGSTLWTYIEPKHRKYIQNKMNDYAMIWVPNEKSKNIFSRSPWKPYRHYTVDDMTKLHIKAVRYISKELKNIKPDEIAILLTHHKPIRTKPTKDIITHAYETDLTNLIIKPPLSVACHGHTHEAMDIHVNGVHILSNPKGYIHERTNYKNSFIFTV